MLDKTTPIKMLNRDSGSVVYAIPEMNGLRRVFQSGEVKEVTFEEIVKLSYLPGGKELLQDSFVLDNDEAIAEILGKVEPEYKYGKDDIIKLMTTGSLDEFLDCLDFAPDGVKELIKEFAVELPLNDVSKRNAIKEKLNFDVDNVLRIKQEAEAEPEEESAPTQRRVKKTQTKTSVPSRRVVKK